MTRIEQIKQALPDYIGKIDFKIFNSRGDLSEVLTYIDVPENKMLHDYYYVEACGCCHGKDPYVEKLDWYLETMHEKLFLDLLEKLLKNA